MQELNRRIWRFTYQPETVKLLPHSAWSTPPHFANADEQANLNDIIATSLNGEPTFSAGVEFYEARFKRDRGDRHAASLMRDNGWTAKMSQGDVRPARRKTYNVAPDRRYEPLVHLCKPSLWVGVSAATLAVPHNATASPSKLLLAPEWLFSHFPYGAFFPSFRECHADSNWRDGRTAVEQRLCMPKFRVPVVMVHMAGLRNGQWGRRGVMRALGVWHGAVGLVAEDDWVSVRSDKLLIVDGAFVASFRSMMEFDHFAARLLLLATLLGRRAVIPSMPCAARWAQAAMEPRHLRGLEVGCGEHKQCVWLPMPHFKEAWCSGVDFVYSIDYEGMLDRKEVEPSRDMVTMTASELHINAGGTGDILGHTVSSSLPTARVLRLTGSDKGDPLDWLPLQGFMNKRWSQQAADALPHRVAAAMDSRQFTAAQMTIMKDCMHSRATSHD